MVTHLRTTSARALRRPLSGVVTVAVLTVASCTDVLEVELPTRVPAETLDSPEMAAVIVTSAIADFECAYANYVIASGLLTDEFYISTEFIAPSLWDQRRIEPDNGNLGTGSCTSFGFGIFTPLQTARFMAELATTKLEAFPDEAVPEKTSLLATVAAYGGYAYTVFGEAFCSATFDGGPALQPAEILAIAEQRFTRAIELAQQAGNTDILNMARVGRARVRLDLGRSAEAAADATLVPEGYTKHVTHSGTTERRENFVYSYNVRQIMISVDPRFRNLTVEGVPDPRVPVEDAERVGHDGVTPLWLQLKYTSESSPIVLASWKEAQLILAEAQGGQAAVDAINRLRAEHDLPAFSSTDPAEIRAQVIEERSRELYAEGHRLNDMLRFGLPFDTGLNHKGVPFGSTTCLPLPQVEIDQNPNV